MGNFRNFGGGFGGAGGMQNLMRQAQKMQEEMARKQAELEEMEVIGSSGGGLVEAVATGKGVIRAVRLKKEVVDPDDIEMLEDLIMAAIGDAQNKAAEAKKELLGPMGDGGLM